MCSVLQELATLLFLAKRVTLPPTVLKGISSSRTPLHLELELSASAELHMHVNVNVIAGLLWLD